MSEAFEVVPSSNKPLKPEHTIIQLILDETGSMNSCKKPTISAYNEFINSQKTAAGTCSVSLIKFSTGYGRGYGFNSLNAAETANVRVVFDNVDINEVPELTEANYSPNGGTNLYDAIGTSIVAMDTILEGLDYIPNVIQVILTDGEENASSEYRLEHIRKMISEKDELTHWNTVYLGANQDAWSVGQTFGLSKGQTMSYSTDNMGSTLEAVACGASSLRESYAMAANSVSLGAMNAGEYRNSMMKSKKAFFAGDKKDAK